MFCSARGDGERERLEGKGANPVHHSPDGAFENHSLCQCTKAEPNIDFKAQDSSGLGKTRPHCVLDKLCCSRTSRKRYGASPGSGTVLTTFLALGPFK